MNKSIKIRKVYTELRHEMGGEVPSSELLKSASDLVDLFDDSEAGVPVDIVEFIDASNARVPVGHRNTSYIFDEWPLDRALSDGGWQVMRREASWGKEIFYDDTMDPEVIAQVNSMTMELYL